MSLNNTVLRLSDHGKEPTKLKFGIDRLLEKSEDKTSSPLKQCFTTISSGIITSNGITKPTPTIAVPCSDCVSSLYRCCKASNICTQGDVAGYIGAHMFGSTTTTYSIQPIRPFATRPNLRITSDPHPQPSPPSNLSISQNSQNKRKRSWSRAVFSNLQRKGLERRFQLQKYITKPDRRQLAATLGLTDAQVKVWFQNRRMKWRHSRESSAQSNENAVDSTQDQEMQIDVDTVTEDVD